MTTSREEIEKLKKQQTETAKRLKELEEGLEENVVKRNKVKELKERIEGLDKKVRELDQQKYKCMDEIGRLKLEMCELEGHNWVASKETDRHERYREEMSKMHCTKCETKKILDPAKVRESLFGGGGYKNIAT